MTLLRGCLRNRNRHRHRNRNRTGIGIGIVIVCLSLPNRHRKKAANTARLLQEAKLLPLNASTGLRVAEGTVGYGWR